MIGEIFGGKLIFLGDFRQPLPIVNRCNRTKIVENCVKSSKSWCNFPNFSLKDNMRIGSGEEKFKQWLLNIADGTYSNNFERDNEVIEIPKRMLVSENNIIKEIFGNNFDDSVNDIDKKVVLAPKNIYVFKINHNILSKLNGDVKEYISIDSCVDDNNKDLSELLPDEFLNSLTRNGLPPHKLIFKKRYYNIAKKY